MISADNRIAVLTAGMEGHDAGSLADKFGHTVPVKADNLIVAGRHSSLLEYLAGFLMQDSDARIA